MDFQNLIGKTVKRIFYNEENLKLITDEGEFCFTVHGDCCSSSMFYDFYGVKNLINSKIMKFENIDLRPSDIVKTGYDSEKDKKGADSSIEVYGFKITAENEQYGEITAVFSFRNYSNGYYGGWMEECSSREISPEIFDDVILTE